MNLLHVIQEAGAMATGHNPELDKMTHLTLITNVSKQLHPAYDFNVNGTMADSLPLAEFKEKYAGKALSEFSDFTKSDIKIMWSNVTIDPTSESSSFMPNLVVRVTGHCSETDAVEFTTLRNRWGSSLVALTLAN